MSQTPRPIISDGKIILLALVGGMAAFAIALVKATGSSVEIVADKSEKTEEKRKDYVYSERSRRSFYRKIPVPEEIAPSKIDARLDNGILVVRLPKKYPAKSGKRATKVEVK